MNERQTYDDSRAYDRPVQASRYTTVRDKSDTELARIVAHRFGWRFNESDEVTEDLGPRIAFTIEDAAAAMIKMGWIPRKGPAWSDMPAESAIAATRVRALLTKDGKYPSRR